jgi:hypothetical protein
MDDGAPERTQPPKQTTPKGAEIPVPKRKEVMDFFKSVTGKRPSGDSASKK